MIVALVTALAVLNVVTTVGIVVVLRDLIRRTRSTRTITTANAHNYPVESTIVIDAGQGKRPVRVVDKSATALLVRDLYPMEWLRYRLPILVRWWPR